MYSSLKRLENDGHITSYWGDETQGGRRRYYRVTARGREQYQQNKQNWDAANKILDTVLYGEDMENRIKQFLDDAFAPYGEFPARAEVTQELLANLLEKYRDAKAEGMTDQAAYQATVDAFGDVEEIMEQVPHAGLSINQTANHDAEANMGIGKTIREDLRKARKNMLSSKFSSVQMEKADLRDTNLSAADFSYSALNGTAFDRSNLSGAVFSAASLRDTSFIEATLGKANFIACDLQRAHFTGAVLQGASFKACSLKDVVFEKAGLRGTTFHGSDLSNLSFEGHVLEDVTFSGASLDKTSFKNATLHNVTFVQTRVKHAIFDGTKMDKVTYALLRGAGAKLDTAVIV